MVTTREVTGKIFMITRLKSSAMGNPRYEVTLDTKDSLPRFKTQVNGSIGYSITNFKQNQLVTLKLEGKTDMITSCKLA